MGRLNGYLSVLNGLQDIYAATIADQNSLMSLVNSIEMIFSDTSNVGTTIAEYALLFLSMEIQKYIDQSSVQSLSTLLTQKILAVASRYIVIHSPTSLSPLVYARVHDLLRKTLHLHSNSLVCGESVYVFSTEQFLTAVQKKRKDIDISLSMTKPLGTYSPNSTAVLLSNTFTRSLSAECFQLELKQWITEPWQHSNLTSLISQVTIQSLGSSVKSPVSRERVNNSSLNLDIRLSLTGYAASRYAAGFSIQLVCVYFDSESNVYTNEGCTVLEYYPDFPTPFYVICRCDVSRMKAKESELNNTSFGVLAYETGIRVVDSNNDNKNSSGRSIGVLVIVGISVGTSFIILILLLWWRKRSGSKKSESDDQDADNIVFETIYHGPMMTTTNFESNSNEKVENSESDISLNDNIQDTHSYKPEEGDTYQKPLRKKSVCFSNSVLSEHSSPSSNRSSSELSKSPSTSEISKSPLQSILKRHSITSDILESPLCEELIEDNQINFEA